MILKKIAALILISLFIATSACLSQEVSTLDSIKIYANRKPTKAINLYHRSKTEIASWPDSTRAEALSEMGKSFFFLPNTDSARVYLNSAMSLYTKLNDKKNIAMMNRFFGNVEFATGNYPESMERFLLAIKESREISDTTMLITNLYNMSLPLRKIGRYEEAIGYLSQAELLSIASKWTKELGNIYNQKGIIYRDWKRDTEASEFFAKAIEAYGADGNRFGKAASLVNQGNCLRSQELYDQALKNHLWALSIYDSLGMKKNICKVNTNIGTVYMEKGDFQNALLYFDSGLKLAIEVNDHYNAYINLQNKGLIHYKLGQYAKSEENFLKALPMGEEKGYKSDLLELYLELCQLYIAKGEGKKANSYLEKYKTLNNIYIKESIEDKISQYQVQFKTLEKENEIQKLSYETAKQALTIQIERRKKAIILIVSLLITLTGASITLLYRNNQKRRRAELNRKKAEIEARLLRVQMNPHFMFNSLNSVQSYIASNQNQLAEDFLSRFAQLTRTILNHSREDFVALSEEVTTLKTYLELEKQRYNNTFDFNIEIDEEVDEDYLFVPPMLVQPFVENAILHGVAPLKQGGTISIRFTPHSSGSVLCTVEDNGVGREASRKVNKGSKHKSLGLQVTNDRLRLIEEQTGFELRVNTTDLTSNNGQPCGTRVEIAIPIRNSYVTSN